jgi:hypothetical protein
MSSYLVKLRENFTFYIISRSVCERLNLRAAYGQTRVFFSAFDALNGLK